MTRSRQNPVSRLLLGCTLLSVAATLYVTRWGFSLPETATAKHAANHSSPSAVEQKLFAAGIVEGLTEPLEVRFEVSGCIQEVLVRNGNWSGKMTYWRSWPRNFTSLRSEKQILIFKRRNCYLRRLLCPEQVVHV